MKKLLALLLVFVMLFSVATLLAGCDDAGKEKKPSSKNDDDEEEEEDDGDNTPSNPSDPSDPSDPGDPSNPSNPGDPSNPSNPGDPSDPANPSDPTVPGEPTEPQNPTEPTIPGEPTEPEPTEPQNPTGPTVPGEPHRHVYGSWTVVKNATCTETGTRNRSCSCGDKETETIPMLAHSYVDSVCKDCGKENYAYSLQIIDGIKADTPYFSFAGALPYKLDGKCYLADKTGKILTPGGYDNMTCTDQQGYVVAYNQKSEVLEYHEDPYWGEMNVTKTVYDCYVLNAKGTVVFQTQMTVLDDQWEGITTYTGEYIFFCNEDRIITYTPNTYELGRARNPMTVNIYNMKGNRLAQFENVESVGTLLNGKLAMSMESYEGDWYAILVVDKNGQVLNYKHIGEYANLESTNWTTRGFINGYMVYLENWDQEAVLISEDLSKSYRIFREYLEHTEHIGTIVSSKIETSSGVSEEYYLIDLAKCEVNEEGYCVPTIAAAVCRQGYDSIALGENLFGDVKKYIVVSRNGKWGYLSLDGSVEKLYDDAGSFFDGKAIVKDGDQIYIIDENFKRISNAVTGYDGISSGGGGVFTLRKDGVWKEAILV